ncbi:uncharacterized protein LOC143018080 isoform X2 [Oratosquilla oratoria]|uniref:uncharacterized protein LOC143018080 isoform X2 n=1 Tax=Oratosquilla oratoria TaxID=337810 RepID=UPI003F757885
MDFQLSVPGPFTYLVHEHARSIIAIQELQREVTSLLEFRDHVLHALPHLQARAHSLTPTSTSAHDQVPPRPHNPTPGASPPVHYHKGEGQELEEQQQHLCHASAATSGAAAAAAHPKTAPPPGYRDEGGESDDLTSTWGSSGRGSGASEVGGGSSGGSSGSSSAGKQRTAPVNSKSLSETHSTVVDSGFSTDKHSSSMGKSSGPEYSGGSEVRWTSVEPEAPPLGTAEDELWHLLDVIQRKGTRLRQELERAERVERQRSDDSQDLASPTTPPPRSHPALTGATSIAAASAGLLSSYGGGLRLGLHPVHLTGLPPPPPQQQQHHHHHHVRPSGEPSPHSLPGMVAPNYRDHFEAAAAWTEMERLRQDRQYLVGRVSRAEAESSLAHQRLIDLHAQLLSLAGEKRRLEEHVRAMRRDEGLDLNLQFVKTNGVRRDGPASTGGIVHSVMGGTNKVQIVSDSSPATSAPSTHQRVSRSSGRVPPSVTVSVAGSVTSPVAGAAESEETGGGGGAVPRSAGRLLRSASTVRVNADDRDVVLPRVLKVPIRDKDRSPRGHRNETESKAEGASTAVSGSSSSSGGGGGGGRDAGGNSTTTLKAQAWTKEGERNRPDATTTTTTAATATTSGSDRVVIERERKSGRVDGGLSMPVSLLKGNRIKVQPNKQRVSAILKVKDVIELQRQLLSTVMETEVLRKQVEYAGEEWVTRSSEYEAQQRQTHQVLTALRSENLSLKAKLDERDRRATAKVDVGVMAHPTHVTVGIMTDEEPPEEPEMPTYTVHKGPNIKYDVVVYQDESPSPPRRVETNNNEVITRKAPPGVEKPPRRSRPGTSTNNQISSSPSGSLRNTGSPPGRRESSGSDASVSRDSLGRVASRASKGSHHTPPSRSTPPATTPRSSPAPSMAHSLHKGASLTPRNGSISSQQENNSRASTPLGRSTSSIAARMVGRRDSVKTGRSTPSSKNSGGSSNSNNNNSASGGSGQHKDTKEHHDEPRNIIQPAPVTVWKPAQSPSVSSPLYQSSVENCIRSPLALSHLCIPSPEVSPELSTNQVKRAGQMSAHQALCKRMSANDLYNKDLSDVEELAVASSSPVAYTTGSDLHISDLQNESSVSSSEDYFDSINGDDEKVMHVKVAFEWNPLPNQDLHYLPPAASSQYPYMWNPNLRPTKHSNSGITSSSWSSAGLRANLNPTLKPRSHQCSRDRQHDKDSLETDVDRGFEAVGRMKNKLRAMNGAVRVKSIDRPSVLNMVQQSLTEDESNANRGESPTGLSSCKPAVEWDLDTRVQQILDRIASGVQQ